MCFFKIIFFFGGVNLFFGKPVKYRIHVYAVIGTRPNFPYTKYGGSERHFCGSANEDKVKKEENLVQILQVSDWRGLLVRTLSEVHFAL